MNRLLRQVPLAGLLVALFPTMFFATPLPLAYAQTQRKKTTVAYRRVDGHAVLADVYRPADDTVRPVIVWIHGAPIMGHREGIHPQVRRLAEEKGYALVSIDYRLAPETKLPELIGDIEAAFRWLAEEGATQFHLDPDRLVVCGGSAGGYLTLVTGYRVQPRPAALVALYGYGSLTSDWYRKPSPHPRHNPRQFSREEALKQTDGSVISDARRRRGNGGIIYLYYRQNGIWPEQVSGFEPATLRDKIAPFEPVRNVTADYPPTLLIHGTEDTDVPFQESAMMAGQLEQNGVDFQLKPIENGEHGFAGGDPQQIEDAYKKMRTFIVAHLEPGTSADSHLVPPKARLETLWNAGGFTEGAAAGPDGMMYFSDFGQPFDSRPARIMKYDPATGKTVVHCTDSKMANGLMFDGKGRLLACCASPLGGQRALVEILDDGTVRPIVERFEGKRFNSPNDLVIDRRGRIYFSDPKYVGPEEMELDSMDVYRLDPDGSLHRATTDISKPNGVMLSPDGTTLYVAETDNGTAEADRVTDAEHGRMTLNAFPVHADGTLGKKRVLVDFGSELGIDGMTVDAAGHIFAAVRSARRFGIVIFDPDGRELDYIRTPELPTNCCFGRGAESKSLYVTAGGGFYRIRLNVDGHHTFGSDSR